MLKTTNELLISYEQIFGQQKLREFLISRFTRNFSILFDDYKSEANSLIDGLSGIWIPRTSFCTKHGIRGIFNYISPFHLPDKWIVSNPLTSYQRYFPFYSNL